MQLLSGGGNLTAAPAPAPAAPAAPAPAQQQLEPRLGGSGGGDVLAEVPDWLAPLPAEEECGGQQRQAQRNVDKAAQLRAAGARPAVVMYGCVMAWKGLGLPAGGGGQRGWASERNAGQGGGACSPGGGWAAPHPSALPPRLNPRPLALKRTPPSTSPPPPEPISTGTR